MNDPNEAKNILFVGNIPPTTTVNAIYHIFSPIGAIALNPSTCQHWITIHYDRNTGASKHSCTITFVDGATATRVITLLNGTKFPGCPLPMNISYAKFKSNQSAANAPSALDVIAAVQNASISAPRLSASLPHPGLNTMNIPHRPYDMMNAAAAREAAYRAAYMNSLRPMAPPAPTTWNSVGPLPPNIEDAPQTLPVRNFVGVPLSFRNVPRAMNVGVTSSAPPAPQDPPARRNEANPPRKNTKPVENLESYLESLGFECPLCNKLPDRIFAICGHIMCRSCISEANRQLNTEGKCPICKTPSRVKSIDE